MELSSYYDFNRGQYEAEFIELSKKFSFLCAVENRPRAFPPQYAIDFFNGLELSVKREVLANMGLMIQMSTPKKTNLERVSRSFEVQCTNRFLKKLSLRYKDPCFSNYFHDGDIIEIFSSTGVQIYRSWSYFNFSSYSLGELLLYSWDELYERPKRTVDQLMSLMGVLFSPEATTIKYSDYGIEPYVLRERHGEHSRAVSLDMKYATPIINDQNMPVAFASIEGGDIIPPSSSPLAFV